MSQERLRLNTNKSVDSLSKDGGCCGTRLDATQLRVAVALEHRLGRDLEMCENMEAPSSNIINGADAGSNGDLEHAGVLLFRPGRIKRTKLDIPLLKKEKTSKTRSNMSSDDEDEERHKDVLSVVVEPAYLLKSAEKAALDAKMNVAPVNPSSDDEGGKAKRRRRKREKEELGLQMKR
jgi:hypothetical protein